MPRPFPAPAAPPRRAVVAALCATALAVDAPPAAAQDATRDATRDARRDTARAVRTDPFCWRGRPLPQCRAFALFEVGYHADLASTELRERVPDFAGGGYERRARDVQPQFLWTVGLMRNRDARTAMGGGLLGGSNGQGGMFGVQGRYRRWMGGSTSAELGVGGLRLRTPEPVNRTQAAFVEDPSRLGVALDAHLDAGNRIAVGTRLVVVPGGGRARVGLLAGGRLGSTFAAAATAAIGAFFAFLFAMIGEDFT